jgi:hypothetical protein
MSPTPIPPRITVDFRNSVKPSRAWILGIDDLAAARIDLDTFSHAPGPAPMPGVSAAILAPPCTCPEFCDRDHANE